MNLTKRIVLHPWMPKIIWTLFILSVFAQVLVNSAMLKATAEAGRESGLQECQQDPNLNLDAPSTQIATDEIPSVPWPYPLPGDLDGDCKVNIVDIMLVVKEWGNRCP